MTARTSQDYTMPLNPIERIFFTLSPLVPLIAFVPFLHKYFTGAIGLPESFIDVGVLVLNITIALGFSLWLLRMVIADYTGGSGEPTAKKSTSKSSERVSPTPMCCCFNDVPADVGRGLTSWLSPSHTSMNVGLPCRASAIEFYGEFFRRIVPDAAPD